jgi:hypothetical protein
MAVELLESVLVIPYTVLAFEEPRKRVVTIRQMRLTKGRGSIPGSQIRQAQRK